jgi:hypothetical protein
MIQFKQKSKLLAEHFGIDTQWLSSIDIDEFLPCYIRTRRQTQISKDVISCPLFLFFFRTRLNWSHLKMFRICKLFSFSFKIVVQCFKRKLTSDILCINVQLNASLFILLLRRMSFVSLVLWVTTRLRVCLEFTYFDQWFIFQENGRRKRSLVNRRSKMNATRREWNMTPHCLDDECSVSDTDAIKTRSRCEKRNRSYDIETVLTYVTRDWKSFLRFIISPSNNIREKFRDWHEKFVNTTQTE